jgi:hypothetical protein
MGPRNDESVINHDTLKHASAHSQEQAGPEEAPGKVKCDAMRTTLHQNEGQRYKKKNISDTGH